MQRFLTILAVLFLLSEIYFAQEKVVPFSSIKINAGILINSNRNLLHEFWKPARGFYLYTETPFYFGDIILGTLYNKFNSKTNIPSFNNYFIFAGWGKELQLPWDVSITTGLKAGSNIFSFASDTVGYFGRTESEFALGVFSRLNLELFNTVDISLSADMENIFTNRRIKLIYLSAGAGYRFPTPGWLRDFLK